MRRLVVAPLLVLATFVVVGASMFTAGAFEDSFERLLPMSNLERRGVVYFDDLDAFAVTTRRGPLVLELRHPIDGHWHTPDTVIFCRSSGLFEAQDSLFDRAGRHLAGPAVRGLDRMATRVGDGWLWVDPAVVTEGPARQITGEPLRIRGPMCRGWFGNWEEIGPNIGKTIPLGS